MPLSPCRSSQVLINANALSDARFHESVKLGEVLCCCFYTHVSDEQASESCREALMTAFT